MTTFEYHGPDEHSPVEHAYRPEAKVTAEDVLRLESIRFQQFKDQVSRYFKARYGDTYVFRAPEMFDNALERWMIYATSDEGSMAEEQMTKIEEAIRSQT